MRPAVSSASLLPVAQSPAGQRSTTSNNAFISYVQSPQGQDPEWIPHAKKGASRTYGGKSTSRKYEIHASIASPTRGVQLRTPFLRKLLRPGTDGSPLAHPAFSETLDLSGRSRSRNKAKQLPVGVNNSLDEAQQALVYAFGSFLKTTRDPTSRRRVGAATFREMCLRHVPQYIELEQAWLDDEDKEVDVDATDQVYTFLQDFGNGATPGFAGLREVVRSHGMQMIVKAIDDKLLSKGIVQQLIQSCKDCEARAEGQAIVHVWPKKARFFGHHKSSQSVKLLIESSQRLDSPEFLFRRLAHLIRNRELANLQLAGLGDIWRLLLHLISQPAGRMDAMLFLEAYVMGDKDTDASHSDRTGRQSPLWNVSVFLTAIIWMQERDGHPRPANNSLWSQLQRLIYSVCMASDSICRSARPLILGAILSTTAAAWVNTSSAVVSNDAYITSFLAQGTSIQHQEDVDFLAQVADVISHVDSSLALDMMKGTVLALVRMATGHAAALSTPYVKRLAVEGAMSWAESRNEAEIYDWAEGVEDLFWARDTDPQAMETPSSSKPIKYRWEAGMCEWIQATPFEKTKRTGMAGSEFSQVDDDSGICMQTSQGLDRKRSRSVTDSEEDSDLEDRDELSMQTPELVRLRDRRIRKAQRQHSPDKENVKPTKERRCFSRQERVLADTEDLSADELGL